MTLHLDSIDAVPLAADQFSFEFRSWLAALVDNLNYTISQLQANTIAPSYTTTEITAMAPDADNGALFYDTTTNELKAKVNNIIVVIA